MIPARPATASALVMMLLAVVAGCAVNPVTGKRELSLMSEAQEVQLGARSDQAIVAQYGLVDDPALASYVSDLGQRLVRVSHRAELAFTIRVLDDPVVNAFALPGGFVYVTRGILAYLDSEAALAGVLGHEVGHVTAKHGVQQATQQTLFGLGLGLGSVLSETFASYAGLASQASGLLLLKFGRDDERQSDALGVEYATRIGYDTRDMAEFFRTLGALSGGASRLPEWTSTHPDPGSRYENVLQLTAEWQPKVGKPSYETDRDRFLQRIDGIVFGPNPREGFVDGGEFKHPDLGFQFPVPGGWQLANGKSQVQMVSEDGNAAILFTLASESTADAAASAFGATSNVTVESRRSVSIGGFSGVRVVASVAQQNGTLKLQSTFIQKGPSVFVFHGMTAAASFSRLEGTFSAVADGFRELRDRDAMNVKPVRVKIIQADRAASFRELVAAYPIPALAKADVDRLALMNGVGATDRIAAGTRLKVLVQE